MNLDGKRTLVLGLGTSGLAMARWCARQGAAVTVADTRAEPPGLRELQRDLPGARFVVEDFMRQPAKNLLAAVDLVLLSPGISGGLLVLLDARARGIPVLGEIELFALGLLDLGVRRTTRVIAITGTNGKTTTTALTGHLCRAAGYDAEVAGNIGPAALDALRARIDSGRLPDVWVLELSSFQLETVSSLAPDVATVLNVSDDHLDRYIDIDEYAQAKARIFEGGGVQVLNRQDARVKKMARPGRRLVTFGLDAPGMALDFGLRENRGEPWLVQGDRYLLAQSQLPITGSHNAANALAALALGQAIDLPQAPLVAGLRSFAGLPHRTQKIAEVGGIAYYDDSKGTNVGATVAALAGIGATLRRGDENDRRNHLPSLGREAGREGAPTAASGDENDRRSHLPPSGREVGREGTSIAARGDENDRRSHLPPSGREVGREGTSIAARGDENDRRSHLPPSGREVGREGTSIAARGDENDRKIVLIAGGDGKGQDFSPLRAAVAKHARAVVLIGRDAPRIETALAGMDIRLVRARDMDEAVARAASLARAADVVLLSPACASLDMYRDYAHRAEAFVAAVDRMRGCAEEEVRAR